MLNVMTIRFGIYAPFGFRNKNTSWQSISEAKNGSLREVGHINLENGVEWKREKWRSANDESNNISLFSGDNNLIRKRRNLTLVPYRAPTNIISKPLPHFAAVSQTNNASPHLHTEIYWKRRIIYWMAILSQYFRGPINSLIYCVMDFIGNKIYISHSLSFVPYIHVIKIIINMYFIPAPFLVIVMP